MRSVLTIIMLCLSMLAGATTETVTWVNPTARVDGTPLTVSDLAASTVTLNGAVVGVVLEPVTSYSYNATCLNATDVWGVTVMDINGLISDGTNVAAKPTCVSTTGMKITVDEGIQSYVTVSWGAIPGAVRYALYLNGKRLITVTGLSSTRTVGTGQCLTTADKYSVVGVMADGSQSAMSQSVAVPRQVCSPSATCTRS